MRRRRRSEFSSISFTTDLNSCSTETPKNSECFFTKSIQTRSSQKTGGISFSKTSMIFSEHQIGRGRSQPRYLTMETSPPCSSKKGCSYFKIAPMEEPMKSEHDLTKSSKYHENLDGESVDFRGDFFGTNPSRHVLQLDGETDEPTISTTRIPP